MLKLSLFICSIIVSGGLFLVNRSFFTESTYRLVHYNQDFVKPAPFQFLIENKALKAKKGEPFVVEVEVQGDEIPQIVYINIEGNNYLMNQVADGRFEFEMASVINSVRFYFTDLKYNSDSYYLELLPKPGINSFTSEVIPPQYTQLKRQRFDNLGDLQVPQGTKVNWQFNGIDIDSLYVMLDDSTEISGNSKR